MAQSLDVTEIVDRQPVSGFLLGVLFVCTLVTLADGYNISVVAFAAPGITKAWHLQRAALGPLFSSSLFAGLIGPFLFGVLADRVGRRNAMMLSVLSIGVFGVVSGYCTSLNALIAVRFIGGIAMSGALAVTVAAVNEFAPRRLRATFVTIVFSGTTIGSGLPGLVAPVVLAQHSWPALFLLGGAVPIVLALGVYLFVPETPKFLCLRNARHAELGQLLQRMVPALAVPTPVSYTLSGESASKRFVLAQLFVGKLAILTPLLWFGSFVAMIVFHSFNTWLPTLLPDTGMTSAQAAHAVVLFQFVGTIGGWVIARPLDRLGMIPCTILYVLSIPVVLSLGLPGHTEGMLMLLISLAGFCILGLHFAQVSCVSSVYPTAVRAFGVGWFMLFARAGGAIGPLIVGALVGAHVPLSTLFYWAAVPLGLGTLASIVVTALYQANYHNRQALPAPFPAQLDATRT